MALNGSGRDAGGADRSSSCSAPGSPRSAPDSPHAVTVPGAIAGWQLLLDRHGTRGLDELLRPAIRCAEEGFPVTPRVAFDWRRDQAALAGCQGGRDYYLPGGKAPEEGRLMRFPALARTLRRIAEGGAKAFYEGETAGRMVAALPGFGGLHTEADFAAATCRVRRPDPQRLPRRRRLRMPAQRPGHRGAADAQHPRALRPQGRWARTRPPGCTCWPRRRGSPFATATRPCATRRTATCRSPACSTRATPVRWPA